MDNTEKTQENGSEAIDASKLTAKLASDPNLMAALQSKMEGLIGKSSGYIESLPDEIQRRIKALKNVQSDLVTLESQFFQEVYELDCKYAELNNSFYDKRRQIVEGKYEPNDEECEWTLDDLDDDEDSQDGEKKVNGTSDSKNGKLTANEDSDKATTQNGEKKLEGIPAFWLTAMKNVSLVGDMISEHDEDLLAKHLIDVSMSVSKAPMFFTLSFHFSPNEYFENDILTKTYHMKCEPNKEDPFSFDGPEIVSCAGCEILWKKGKNLTVKTVYRKQKHKSKEGVVRTLSQTMPNDSFFNFFAPPKGATSQGNGEDVDLDELEDNEKEVIASDFEIGHFFRNNLIPRAVLYFTGEAIEDSESEEEEDDDDDDESEDDDAEEGENSGSDNDPDFDVEKAVKKQNGGGAKKNGEQECKQQ